MVYSKLCSWAIYAAAMTWAWAPVGAATSTASDKNAPPAFPGGAQAELWLVAGQSNMVGGGVSQADYARFHHAPDPRLWMFTLDQHWAPAQPPIHHMFEAVQAIHREIRCQQHQITMAKYDEMGRENRGVYAKGGYCPGYTFGRRLAETLDKPVGLIACAECGTSIDQWDPSLKDKGAGSLYGAMLEQARLAGGRPRGMIWYQGESDCGGNDAQSAAYQTKLLNLVDHLRQDTGNPQLAVIVVQIGRRMWADPKMAADRSCEIVREAQRLATGKRKNLYLVTAVDCPLHDNNVHITGESCQRVGARLAEVALSKVYRQSGHAQPIEPLSATLEKDGAGSCVKVRLRGVSGRLRASSATPTGFELRQDTKTAAILPLALRVEFDPRDPASILLKSTKPLTPPLYLYYGADHAPQANIVDAKDSALPAFGPLEVRPTQ